MELFPAFLSLRGMTCLVVGGGATAAAKARLLFAAHADVTIVSPLPSPDVLELNGSRIRVERRGFRRDDVDGRGAVISATGDLTIDEQVSRAARDAGVPVNVVDNADLSTFVVPAIVDRDPIVIGIGSGGSAPALARRVRGQIEAALPARLGELARFAGRFRDAVKAVRADASRRRGFWEDFFDGPIAAKVLGGHETSAAEDMVAVVNSGHDAATTGSVAIVGAGPGDPDLLTLKALRALQGADVVVYDRLVGPEILNFARRDAIVFLPAKRVTTTR